MRIHWLFVGLFAYAVLTYADWRIAFGVALVNVAGNLRREQQ